jgi:hypothetical protein
MVNAGLKSAGKLTVFVIRMVAIRTGNPGVSITSLPAAALVVVKRI